MAIEAVKIVSAKDVETFHRNSDLNKRSESQHHSLGTGPTMASPGSHRHLGSDGSLSLFAGDIITGSLSGATGAVLGQVIAALTQVGIIDGTTP